MRIDLHDHQAIQCDAAWPVQLSGRPSERATLCVHDDETAVQLSANGIASVMLPPMSAGTAFDVVVRHEGGETAARDLIAGDVWVCSGQSNMAMTLDRTDNGEAVAQSSDIESLRLCTVQRTVADAPADAVGPSWSRCLPTTAGTFSAVAYYFGERLVRDTGRPIGLVNASVGATPAEAWMPMAALESESAFAPILDRWRESLRLDADASIDAASRYEQVFVDWDGVTDAAERAGRRLPGPQPKHIPSGHAWTPAGLFNGMIAPLTTKPIRGVIWYQGEAAPERASQYERLFRALIRSWRAAWAASDLPFCFVQLARFGPRRDTPGEHSWAELREAQAAVLNEPATGMAVAIDTGDPVDPHATEKSPIGHRLAAEALALAYGRSDVDRSPRLADVRFDGAHAVLRFESRTPGAAVSLRTADGKRARGFALSADPGDTSCGNRGFHWADAEINGDTVTITSPDVARPIAVRYAWAQNPACNLVSGAGVPVAPFRSDDWPGVTVGIA